MLAAGAVVVIAAPPQVRRQSRCRYLKKKPETAVLLLLLGLVVLAGIALGRGWTASNRKAEQAASEAADGSIPVLAIPSDTVRKIQMEARSGTLTLAYADGSWSLAEDRTTIWMNPPATPC